MKHQFVTYEMAKKLKELGFDENCFGYYTLSGNFFGHDFKKAEMLKNSQLHEDVSAPLWQQAIDWLRIHKQIEIALGTSVPNTNTFGFGIYQKNIKTGEILISGYHEAREAAILKALELISK